MGCPTGVKQSVRLAVLPDACAHGAGIVTGARVLRILLDHDRPGPPPAAGILARRADGSEPMIADRPAGRVLGQGRTLVRYRPDPRDGARLMTAV
ncbi:GMC family oxidoreductase N-terminal domain-containing protein [Streptomyces guryensis]|uniref:GMC family oxidoreductase N-terminal domain-containing protein n=1 Tax=Streptomyces guryensis TaxID=2886947 RepID=A0A9Q3Z8Z3_9ACTN|nr:GMC family oxidoreductase N-terminal domain-containing protein [Streptomyces guryensis]MCD9877799.1 GMC family oxidoreductase N-terminal domain-containing protein [Streptomyces guryensis]